MMCDQRVTDVPEVFSLNEPAQPVYRDRLGTMSVEEACRWILGRKIADAIIDDMGLRWTIVTAMAAATTNDNPEAIKALRQAMRNV